LVVEIVLAEKSIAFVEGRDVSCLMTVAVEMRVLEEAKAKAVLACIRTAFANMLGNGRQDRAT
jgi:hypothetical protein